MVTVTNFNNNKMKFLSFLMFCSVLICSCYALENILHGEFYNCVKCLCHTVSGCWRRENCAKYSINQRYWIDAGAPRVLESHQPNSPEAFQACIKDENCIVHTIKQYTDQRLTDCNCDGKIDCKDLLAIHLGMGEKQNCVDPQFKKYEIRRFNQCANDIQVPLMKEDEANCVVPDQ